MNINQKAIITEAVSPIFVGQTLKDVKETFKHGCDFVFKCEDGVLYRVKTGQVSITKVVKDL
jgi:hypothetical protein